MAKPIVWLPLARRNLDNQLAYIAERNPRAAVEVGDAVEQAIEQLDEFTHRIRPGRVPGTRELVVVGTPNVVICRIEPHAVLILRVLHGAQPWPPREG